MKNKVLLLLIGIALIAPLAVFLLTNRPRNIIL